MTSAAATASPGAFGGGNEAAENAAEDDDRQQEGPQRLFESLPDAGKLEFLLDREVVTHGLDIGCDRETDGADNAGQDASDEHLHD